MASSLNLGKNKESLERLWKKKGQIPNRRVLGDSGR